MNIPDWLTHLRTDRRGLPVPYINVWGAESTAQVRVAFDRHVAAPAVFLDDDPAGEPDFTKQNFQRQRECMIDGLCQVCARPVPWSRRFLVLADVTVDRVTVPGMGSVAVTHEPWLCERCARFAITKCPALIRRARTERLTLIPVTSKRQVEFIISNGWVEGPLEAETKADPPVFWVKLAVPARLFAAGEAMIAFVAPDQIGGGE